MMGTQQRKADHHHQQHGVIQSSIALLQERFRQLQRVKEMREKRELLIRIFSNHNTINNNTNTSTGLLSTSTSTTTTTATISTDTNNNNLNNNNNNNSNFPADSSMQYSYHHEPYCHDDGEDKELQVFLPPNYYNHKPWSYSSSSSSSSSSSPQSSPSSVSPSSSSSSSDNKSEVSLSLWPSAPPCNITAVSSSRPCTSKAFKFQESHHVSDVDTTLHL